MKSPSPDPAISPEVESEYHSIMFDPSVPVGEHVTHGAHALVLSHHAGMDGGASQSIESVPRVPETPMPTTTVPAAAVSEKETTGPSIDLIHTIIPDKIHTHHVAVRIPIRTSVSTIPKVPSISLPLPPPAPVPVPTNSTQLTTESNSNTSVHNEVAKKEYTQSTTIPSAPSSSAPASTPIVVDTPSPSISPSISPVIIGEVSIRIASTVESNAAAASTSAFVEIDASKPVQPIEPNPSTANSNTNPTTSSQATYHSISSSDDEEIGDDDFSDPELDVSPVAPSPSPPPPPPPEPTSLIDPISQPCFCGDTRQELNDVMCSRRFPKPAGHICLSIHLACLRQLCGEGWSKFRMHSSVFLCKSCVQERPEGYDIVVRTNNGAVYNPRTIHETTTSSTTPSDVRTNLPPPSRISLPIGTYQQQTSSKPSSQPLSPSSSSSLSSLTWLYFYPVIPPIDLKRITFLHDSEIISKHTNVEVHRPMFGRGKRQRKPKKVIDGDDDDVDAEGKRETTTMVGRTNGQTSGGGGGVGGIIRPRKRKDQIEHEGTNANAVVVSKKRLIDMKVSPSSSPPPPPSRLNKRPPNSIPSPPMSPSPTPPHPPHSSSSRSCPLDPGPPPPTNGLIPLQLSTHPMNKDTNGTWWCRCTCQECKSHIATTIPSSSSTSPTTTSLDALRMMCIGHSPGASGAAAAAAAAAPSSDSIGILPRCLYEPLSRLIELSGLNLKELKSMTRMLLKQMLFAAIQTLTREQQASDTHTIRMMGRTAHCFPRLTHSLCLNDSLRVS